MKKCNFCGEEILDDAQKCRYCREWLIDEPIIPDEAAHNIYPVEEPVAQIAEERADEPVQKNAKGEDHGVDLPKEIHKLVNRKFGYTWGWLVFVLIAFGAVSKLGESYKSPDYGFYATAIQFVGVILSLVAYIIIRKNFIKRYEPRHVWGWSVLAGVISYIILVFLVGIPIGFLRRADSEIQYRQSLKFLNEFLNSTVDLSSEETRLWSEFNSISDAGEHVEENKMKLAELLMNIEKQRDSLTNAFDKSRYLLPEKKVTVYEELISIKNDYFSKYLDGLRFYLTYYESFDIEKLNKAIELLDETEQVREKYMRSLTKLYDLK